MNMNLKLVTALAAGVPVRAGSRWVPRAVVDMKLRDFIRWICGASRRR